MVRAVEIEMIKRALDLLKLEASAQQRVLPQSQSSNRGCLGIDLQRIRPVDSCVKLRDDTERLIVRTWRCVFEQNVIPRKRFCTFAGLCL